VVFIMYSDSFDDDFVVRSTKTVTTVKETRISKGSSKGLSKESNQKVEKFNQKINNLPVSGVEKSLKCTKLLKPNILRKREGRKFSGPVVASNLEQYENVILNRVNIYELNYDQLEFVAKSNNIDYSEILKTKTRYGRKRRLHDLVKSFLISKFHSREQEEIVEILVNFQSQK